MRLASSATTFRTPARSASKSRGQFFENVLGGAIGDPERAAAQTCAWTRRSRFSRKELWRRPATRPTSRFRATDSWSSQWKRRRHDRQLLHARWVRPRSTQDGNLVNQKTVSTCKVTRRPDLELSARSSATSRFPRPRFRRKATTAINDDREPRHNLDDADCAVGSGKSGCNVELFRPTVISSSIRWVTRIRSTCISATTAQAAGTFTRSRKAVRSAAARREPTTKSQPAPSRSTRAAHCKPSRWHLLPSRSTAHLRNRSASISALPSRPAARASAAPRSSDPTATCRRRAKTVIRRGDLTGVSVDGNGVVNGNYSNGQTIAVAQLAVAKFQSNEGLGKAESQLVDRHHRFGRRCDRNCRKRRSGSGRFRIARAIERRHRFAIRRPHRTSTRIPGELEDDHDCGSNAASTSST